MMKLTMLGTGNALVTECYNTCFVISDNDKHLMVDGGGGNNVLHQLKHAGVNWMDIKDIFVTHKHIDHILGIVWMVRLICQNMSSGKYEGEANIYGHEEVIDLIDDISHKLLTSKQTKFIGDRLHLVVVKDKEKMIIIDKEITFFDIQSTKAKQFGFTMDLGKGEKLTCCGDETYNECDEKYVKDSKWLLHEAFCLYSQSDIFKPYEKHHSTVKDACEIAERMHVENLILYHTEDRNLAQRKKLYTEEGSRYFRGNLYVPEDLETINIAD